MITCPDCGNAVSPRANSCPQCGRVFKEPKRRSVFGTVLAVLFSLLFIFIGGCVVIGMLTVGGPAFLAARERAKTQPAREEAEKTEALNKFLAKSNEVFEAKQEAVKADESARLAEAAAKLEIENRKRKAFESTEAKAKSGDAFYQLRLGELYMKGEGTSADSEQAKAWLFKAWGGGQTQASNLIYQIRASEVGAK